MFLAGLNLCLRFTAQHVGAFDFVRWREILALLAIVPVSVGIMFQVYCTLEQGRRDTNWLVTVMGVCACMLGISMGVHEPINALPHLKLYVTLKPAFDFWDEIFSHAVFYMAFIGISLSMLWSQVRNPLPVAMNLRATAAFGSLAVIAGTGIFLTLVPGCRWVDLAVIALLLLVAEWMRRGTAFRQLPLTIVIESACLLAFIGLVTRQFLSGRW